MNDALILEQIELVKDRTLVLLGTDECIEDLACILNKGSGLSFVRAKKPEDFKSIPDREPLWLIISIEVIPDWKDLLDEAAQRGCYISTSRVTLDSIYLNRGSRIFTDAYRKEIDAFYLQRRIIGANIAFNIAGMKLLSDLDLDEFGEDPLALAYSHVKTGSSTIQASLASLGYPDIDVHAIRGEKILRKLKSLPKLQLICGVREPIIQRFSFFFQLYIGLPNSRIDEGFREVYEELDTFSRNMSRFLFEVEPSAYGPMFGWFDSELKNNFGIDIFEQGFDRERGYSIYENGTVSAFVYKLEKLNDLEKPLGEFLGRDDFRLISVNDSASKYIKYLYQDMKKTLSVPEHIVRFYYDDNERMRFFYTQEEIEAFRRRITIIPD